MSEHCRLIIEEEYDNMLESFDRIEEENAELTKKLKIAETGLKVISKANDLHFDWKQVAEDTLEKMKGIV